MALKKNKEKVVPRAAGTPEVSQLISREPEVERQLKKGREFTAKYYETFRALARATKLH